MMGVTHLLTARYMKEDPLTKSLYHNMFYDDGAAFVCRNVWISSLTGTYKEKGTIVEGRLSTGYGGKGVFKNNTKSMGPEFAFGLSLGLEQDNRNILLIKTAWGGASLHEHFRPPSKNNGEGGIRYKQMMERIKTEITEVSRTYGDSYEIAGFFWFHGWSDYCNKKVYPTSLNHKRYDEYGLLLEAFIDDVRADLGTPSLPFCIGVTGIHGDFVDGHYPKQVKGYNRLFRKAMRYPSTLEKNKGTVSALETSEFWDDDLARINMRRVKLHNMAKNLYQKKKGYPNEAGTMTKIDIHTYLNDYNRELMTAEDNALWARAATIDGFENYFGSAKIISEIGRAAALQIMEMEGLSH